MGRDRGSATRIVAAFASLLLALVLVVAWWQWPEPNPARSSSTERRHEEAVEPVSATPMGARSAAAAAANGVPTEPVSISTFVDGEPMPSLLHDLAQNQHGWADWAKAVPSHDVPATGKRFAVLARDCVVVFLARSQIPERGDLRVDLRRAPVLDVRLVNVPPTLRDKLDLQLQVSYGRLSADENVASCMMEDRAPVRMDTDRALCPLALAIPGNVAAYAMSRHSSHSYPTPKRSFEPVSQVIEIDLAVLEPACHLVSLNLALRFPYEHPRDEFALALQDGRRWNLMSQRAKREGARELSFVFRDLPRAVVYPLLTFEGPRALPQLYLDPIDLSRGDATVVREVVAESSMRVVLSGREGLADDGVSVLLRNGEGAVIEGNWPRDAETRFEHLRAGSYLVQAIGYDGHRCSSIARVVLGVTTANEVSLQLVPAARILIEPRAFGQAARHIDVHYPPEPANRVWLADERETMVWLPIGSPRVTWEGGAATLPVKAGVDNRWP